jgi:gamma-glutamylcyclotransferase (GGCT)/AIG2-like uncharacterized protein YtfP
MPPTSRPSSRLAHLSEEPAALFAYGTLRFPDVLQTLLDRVPSTAPATVTGWRVAALRERVYPVLVPAATTANGLVLTDLSRTEWHTLDAFEDPLYTLQQLSLNDGHHAWAYATEHDPAVLPHDWDINRFTHDELASYIERCQRWRRRYEQQTATP